MIADRIKLLREKSGLNQSELAEKLRLSRNSISAYEKGLNIPSTQIIAKLAEILGVSVDCILGIENTATISVKGLDDKEVAILVEIANKFRENKKVK
jgi:transcriptional regulator with XRE-family HTH domain